MGHSPAPSCRVVGSNPLNCVLDYSWYGGSGVLCQSFEYRPMDPLKSIFPAPYLKNVVTKRSTLAVR